MIATAMFLLLLGLIVFGPKKTLEMAKSAGKLVAQLKHAAGKLESELATDVRDHDQVCDADGRPRHKL